MTAGIDFAFTLLAEIAGEGYAKALTLGAEYSPAPPYGCGRPELADHDALARTSANMDKSMALRMAEVKEAGTRLNRYAVSP
ncbi:MAG: hypothetical protein WEA77_02030 [Hyphomonas sp.]